MLNLQVLRDTGEEEADSSGKMTCGLLCMYDEKMKVPVSSVLRRAAVPAGFQASLFKLFLHYLIICSK